MSKEKQPPIPSESNAETHERQRQRAADFRHRLTELHARFVNFNQEMAALDFHTKQNLENKDRLTKHMASMSLLLGLKKAKESSPMQSKTVGTDISLL
uniref:Uncharacterized protein n=1 Tax=Plectus sambesii TaxID=2011161 RepID=A0A914X9E2_9BILA